MSIKITVDNQNFSKQLKEIMDSESFQKLLVTQRNMLGELFPYRPSGICTPHRNSVTGYMNWIEIEEEPIPVELPQYSIELPITVDK